MNTKPKCFTDHQWEVYQIELNTSKNGKKLDICFDCIVQYQTELIVRKAMDYAPRNWEHGHLLAEDLRVYFGVEK